MNLIILTCVLWKAGSDADLQRFTGRLQYRYVALTLDKHNLPGAATTQEAPVLLLQLHLQSAGHTYTVHGRITSKKNSAKESSFAEFPHIFSFILMTCEYICKKGLQKEHRWLVFVVFLKFFVFFPPQVTNWCLLTCC